MSPNAPSPATQPSRHLVSPRQTNITRDALSRYLGTFLVLVSSAWSGVAGFCPMPMLAMRAAFKAGNSKVQSKKRRVIVSSALRAVPEAIKCLDQINPAKTEISEQNHSANKIEQQPTLNDNRPKRFCPGPRRSRPSRDNGRLPSQCQRNRTGEAQREPTAQTPKRHGDKRTVKNADHQALSHEAAELIEGYAANAGIRATRSATNHISPIAKPTPMASA